MFHTHRETVRLWPLECSSTEDGARGGRRGAQRLGAHLLRGRLRNPRLPDPQHRGAGHRPGSRALRTSHGLAAGQYHKRCLIVRFI